MKVELTTKELSMISKALSEHENTHGFIFPNMKALLCVGNSDGSNDYVINTTREQWYKLENKLMGLIEKSWKSGDKPKGKSLWKKENNHGIQ